MESLLLDEFYIPVYNKLHLSNTGYEVYSDWYPSPFLHEGMKFACSGVALLYRKCLTLGYTNHYLKRVMEVNGMMLHFYTLFDISSSPRFWNRWSEQIQVLIDFNRKYLFNKFISYSPDEWFSIIYSDLVEITRSKLISNERFAIRLISSKEKIIREEMNGNGSNGTTMLFIEELGGVESLHRYNSITVEILRLLRKEV